MNGSFRNAALVLIDSIPQPPEVVLLRGSAAGGPPPQATGPPVDPAAKVTISGTAGKAVELAKAAKDSGDKEVVKGLESALAQLRTGDQPRMARFIDSLSGIRSADAQAFDEVLRTVAEVTASGAKNQLGAYADAVNAAFTQSGVDRVASLTDATQTLVRTDRTGVNAGLADDLRAFLYTYGQALTKDPGRVNSTGLAGEAASDEGHQRYSDDQRVPSAKPRRARAA